MFCFKDYLSPGTSVWAVLHWAINAQSGLYCRSVDSAMERNWRQFSEMTETTKDLEVTGFCEKVSIPSPNRFKPINCYQSRLDQFKNCQWLFGRGMDFHDFFRNLGNRLMACYCMYLCFSWSWKENLEGKLFLPPIGTFWGKQLSLWFGRLGVDCAHAVLSENLLSVSSGLKIGP